MNNLTLRTLTSPYINDVTRGSVLSQADVDNNFIFLKGNIVYTAETIGNIVTLKRFNGDDLSFIAGETFTGGTISGATNFIGGLTADTFSATTYFGLPQDIYVTGGTYLNGTYTFTNNTGGTFNINTSTNYAAGVISGATDWSPTGTGQINLPNIKVALYDNADNIEPIIVYDIASGTTGVSGIPLLSDNDTNYIVIEYNSGTPRYNVYNNDGIVDDSSTVLFMIVYRAGNFVHTLEFGNQGAGLANKLNDRVIMTNRFGWESGLMIGLSGTGVVTLTSGVAWNGANRQVLNQCDSSGNTFFKNYHVGGSWTYTTTGDTFNNTYYDNGTDIVSGTTGKYLINWYFRGQEINDHLYEVYDTNEYDSIILAEASPEPLVPELISSHAFLVGRIIVGVGETTGLTQTAFGTVFQSSGKFSSTTIHNDLTGIQGGTGGEYYHLTSNEYNNLSLTNIDNDFTSQQTFNNGLSANTISATTYYGLPQDVYVTGGTYSSGTTTFTNNLGNTFDVTGYFTGSTVVPSEIVYFDSTNPNISGTTFDPDIQMSADTLYVSSVDANTWVYSGASYVTYSAATVSNTEFNLNGTSVDAGGNKTAHISRSGSITIGGTGQTTDKFSVFTTSGLKTLTADNLGSVYNNGKGGLITNNAFGYQSLLNNTIGANNSAFGYRAMLFNLSGNSNSAFGYETLINNIGGNYNTAIGYASMRTNSTGIANASMGFQALYSNTTGSYNTSNGFAALYNNTTANYNTAIGYNSMFSNTTGTTNVALGAFSLYSNVGNNNNTAIGTNALRLSNGGYDNTALGFQALYSNTVGFSNTALGKDTLFSNTSGATNVAIGDRTLFSNTNGSYNVGIGYRSLYDNTTGNYNIAMGFQALYLNLSGNSNTAIGASVLNSNSTGSNNIGIGTNALKQSTTASNNIGIGINALSTSTTGASNIGIGTSSQQLLTIGISNVSIGANSSLSNITGSANVAIGQDSLYNNTSSNNTAIGYRSGYNLINGTSNTIIGANSVVPSGLTASLVLSDGNGVVKLSADSAHRLFIPTSPSTGTTSDSLLVRTSGGEIKQLPVSSISSSFGAFGISSSAGTYTYYSTLTLAMSAATAGDTIEVFADYTESVSGTTVLIKPNVVVQGNGHTYKHTATGDTDTFSFGTNDDHFIYNYNIIRTNATGGYVFNRVPYVPYNVYCNGTTVKTNQNGILFHFSQPGNVYNLTLISTGGGIGVQGSGSNFNNCLFIGTSTSTNSLASAGSVLNNCSVINRGSGISIGDCYLNSTSVISYSSAAASGTYGVRNSFIYSSTSYGLLPFNGGIVENTVIQSAGSYAAYIYNSNCRFDNCKLISSVNNAFYAGLGIDAKLNNCVLVSSAAIALNAHSVEVTNSTIESTWNNASGHAVAVVSNDTVITNCMLRVANSSANAIYGSSAFSPKFANNVYANMTTPINANITQGIINTQDNQGNILI